MYKNISLLCAKYVLLVPPDVIETSGIGIYSTVGKVKKKTVKLQFFTKKIVSEGYTDDTKLFANVLLVL